MGQQIEVTNSSISDFIIIAGIKPYILHHMLLENMQKFKQLQTFYNVLEDGNILVVPGAVK